MRIPAILAALITFLLLCSAARADDSEPVVHARKHLALLTAGKFDEFAAAGDETMRSKFTATDAQRAWAGLLIRLGPYEREEQAAVQEAGGHQVVRFQLRFKRGLQNLRLVLNAENQIAGFWFDETIDTQEYKPPPYVKPDRFRDEQVTVSAGEHPLPGTLSLPVADGPHPAVVLLHGSGPHDQDETIGGHKPFRDLAGGLASRGIAVLRYEKRTKAHPGARPPGAWTLADEVLDDAVAALDLLRKRPEVDPQRIYIAGHSLGGTAAIYVAQRKPAPAGVILLAATPRSLLDLMQEQTEYLAQLDGTISPEEQAALDQLKQVTAAIRAGRLEDVPAGGALPARYLADLEKLAPGKAAAELRVPMLVVQGGRDYQVTKVDFEAWKAALADRKDVRFLLLDDLNHLFVAGQGRSTPLEYQGSGAVDVRVIEALGEWITRPAR